MSEAHIQLKRALTGPVPEDRLIDDPLRTLAYGTDASFYRLTPQLVVKLQHEHELIALLKLARQYDVPITFRAAGTSLSGQAVTDSVLAVLDGDHWREYEIGDGGDTIRLQPGVIGAQANAWLAPLGRKIGPDPASIGTAKIGGIAANNASGMCCGTAHNSYQTLESMRVVLVDGEVLDTASASSVEDFRRHHANLLDRLGELAARVRGNPNLSERIRHKYRLKNTTGYSLNALLDFTDPVDVLIHLMIGSEGTLGFISSITYRTIPELPCKATSLVLFPNVETACNAVSALKPFPVDAVELMDRAALHSVQDGPSMPEGLAELADDAAALLIDVKGEDENQLQVRLVEVEALLQGFDPVRAVRFTSDPAEYTDLWNIRKGLFPAVGAVRQVGTTVIIEDVAFPVEQLAQGTRALQALFERHGYHEAIIFGHALEGNLHFVFTQDFAVPDEVARYAAFMREVAELVAGEYGGSLKAEHGTGRNMAPFVELEWGEEAYSLMWEIKQLFDPNNLLNPGVILNQDRNIHLKNLKPLPPAASLVDRCIECGFCEPICPSRNLTLTPRQRITVLREIARLERSQENADRLARLRRDYRYLGMETCATDGLCATRCPVGIDTGLMIKSLRAEHWGGMAVAVGDFAQRNFSALAGAVRWGLKFSKLADGVLGHEGLEKLGRGLSFASGGRIPRLHRWMPGAAGKLPRVADGGDQPKVVYLPSCAARAMGAALADEDQRDLMQVTEALLRKAGYDMVLPPGLNGLCCGQPFDSKGLKAQAGAALRQLEDSLWRASGQGRLPVFCDTSPCTLRMQQGFERSFEIYEPIRFARQVLLPRLQAVRQRESVVIHVTCSARKMGLAEDLLALAKACARQVLVPEETSCCGFAGDKGFMTPELNAAGLSRLRQQIPSGCEAGFSNSRTCEIGLSQHSGIPYRSVLYLVDECFEAPVQVRPSRT